LLVPKLFTTLSGYRRQDFLKDLGAGVIVGIVALPLAIAFAIASGVTPEKGLITAIVAGFLVSALGGSRVQIGGPTGAFVVVIFTVVQKYGLDGLIVTTFFAGIVLIVFGLAKFGAAIKFIPAPVIVGFTSGIAVIIFSSEVPDFLGIKLTNPPSDFYEKWSLYFSHIGSSNLYAVLTAVVTLLILVYWPRINRTIPSPFIGLIVSTFLVWALKIPVETIGSRFGSIPASLPSPHIPIISFTVFKELVPSIFTVAVLASVESLLSAVVADGMIGSKHRSNMELVAQGIANIGSSIFGGIPATGAIARTATNIKSGGRTPIAGIVHALTLLLIMLLFGHLASLIPLAALAAILVVVAYNMSEWRSFIDIFRAPKSDIAVLITTFVLTVVINLTVAIEVGMVMAAFLFMHRMAQVSNVKVMMTGTEDPSADSGDEIESLLPKGVMVFEIRGALFFGAAERFAETLTAVNSFPKVLILRMGDAVAIDATGLRALGDVLKRAQAHRGLLLISEIHSQPFMAADKAGLLDLIGRDNLHATLAESLDHANEWLRTAT
jgi:SulP family sulfate permease